jgi:hypothetical protein
MAIEHRTSASQWADRYASGAVARSETKKFARIPARSGKFPHPPARLLRIPAAVLRVPSQTGCALPASYVDCVHRLPAPKPNSKTETSTWRTNMNIFEKNPSKDTFLSGGLVAIAIAWVVLAAIQGPVGAPADQAAAFVAASGAAASAVKS